MLACSSRDGSDNGVAAGDNEMAPAGAQPGGEAASPGAPGKLGNSDTAGSAAGSSANGSPGSESVSEALPLTPSAMLPGGTPAPPAPPAPPGAPLQQALPDLISVRQEHAAVALGGEIYVIGGFTPTVTATVEAFDTAAQTWRAVASLPAALHHANAASVNGRIYVAGFYLGSSFTNADPRVLEYDPAQNSWSERTPMPAGSERATSCVAALDGKIYLFGGARATTVSDASVYDVAADSWQALPPLPEAREHCVVGAIGGTLYIASGRAGGITGFQRNTWAFDPATQAYSPRAPIPTARGGTAGAVLAERLLIFGGEGNPAPATFGVWPNIDAYEPASDSWQALAPMLLPRHGLGAAVSDGRVYLPGGAAAQGFGAVNDHTVLSFDSSAL